MKDLVVLVADKKMEAALRHLLQRHDALGVRPIRADIFCHPRHDPGVLLEAAKFLSVFSRQYRHALVFFDHDGCGQEHKSAPDLEQQVQEQLDAQGWEGRSGVIVFEPELEIWVWSDSPHVPKILGLEPARLDQLISQAARSNRNKPERPKELMEKALHQSRVAWSAALYAELAKKVSTARCVDPAFQRLKQILSRWFPRKTERPGV